MSSPIFFIRMFLTYAALLHKSGAQDLRLANGQNSCVGRVEVSNEGKWDSVCDDDFGMNEGNVVCKQLGCGYPRSVYGWAYFGKGSGSIMHYFQCNGSETSIWNCSHSARNETDCAPLEAIGIICSGSINRETTTLSPELNEANSTSSPSTLADSGPTTIFTTEPPTSALAAPTSSPEKKTDFTSAALVTTSTQTTAAPAVTAEAASDPAPTSSPEKKAAFTSAALVTTSTQTTAAPAITTEAASDPAPTSSPEKKAAFTSAALVTTSTQTTAAPAITTEAASDPAPTSSPEKKAAFTSAALVTTSTQTTAAALVTTSTQTTTAPAITTEAASDRVTMTCWPEKMMAVISKVYIRSKGCSPTGLLVNNRRVRYQVKEDHVVIPMSYKAYETRTERTGNIVSYSNTVSCSGMSDGKMRTVQIRFICKINQKTRKEETHIVDESDCTGKDQMQNGRKKIILSFYSQPFSRPTCPLPYFVNSNQNEDIRVTITTYSPGIVLFLDTCVASPDPNDFSTSNRYLIKNGCPFDSSFTSSHSVTRRTIQFRVFPIHFRQVNIRCKILACRKYDFRSRCYQGCQRRHKRETSFDFQHEHVLGPFTLE